MANYSADLGAYVEHLLEIKEFLAFMDEFLKIVPREVRRLVVRFK